MVWLSWTRGHESWPWEQVILREELALTASAYATVGEYVLVHKYDVFFFVLFLFSCLGSFFLR